MPTWKGASCPEHPPWRPDISAARYLLAVGLLCLGLLPPGPGLAADSAPPVVVPRIGPGDSAQPIDLEAAFSEFDRRNNRLVFRQLNIRQGSLAIKADEATADPADFEDSVWVFTGSVAIDNGPTKARCERAELTFRDNQLRKAVLTGKPARFTQTGSGGSATEGRGEELQYDLDAGTIQMIRDAYLSDGRSEIAGNRIAYDLRREVVTAGGAESGQVRMRITPQTTPSPSPLPSPSPPVTPP